MGFLTKGPLVTILTGARIVLSGASVGFARILLWSTCACGLGGVVGSCGGQTGSGNLRSMSVQLADGSVPDGAVGESDAGTVEASPTVEASAPEASVDAEPDASVADEQPVDIDAGCTIVASSYDQSCTMDTDCAFVFEGNTCLAGCQCLNAAVNVHVSASYMTDLAKISVDAGQVNCGCTAFIGPCCRAGLCKVGQACTQP